MYPWHELTWKTGVLVILVPAICVGIATALLYSLSLLV